MTAQIVHATYDFVKGTEYDKFATAAYYNAIKNTHADGFKHFFVDLCYGKCTVYKIFIHPFADHYVAIDLNPGAYEFGSMVDAQVSKFKASEYPAER